MNKKVTISKNFIHIFPIPNGFLYFCINVYQIVLSYESFGKIICRKVIESKSD